MIGLYYTYTYNRSSVVAKAKVNNGGLYVLGHDDRLYADACSYITDNILWIMA